VESLAAETEWLVLESYELTRHPEHVSTYMEMAGSLGQEARSVPAFLYCGRMQTGYASDDTTGAALRAGLEACRSSVTAASDPATAIGSPPESRPEETADRFRVPVIGELAPEALSLPMMTVLIAGLDAFNPCAFFVLLFLLSLLVHARNRGRMALVGGVFVFCSGLVYFLFMAAWLNVFLWIGELNWVTRIAGGIALLVGLINAKDFFWFQRGITLSIPAQAKPGLFQRMRGVLNTAALPALLLGTVTLALAANAYELLCTSGFPLVYTRILTLKALPTGTYYLYLALYNLVYVTPLLVIVGIVTWTLGARKLDERSGRTLKLVSGTMMLSLGVVLILAPHRLSDPLFAILIPVAAVSLAVLVILGERVVRGTRGSGLPGSGASPPTKQG